MLSPKWDGRDSFRIPEVAEIFSISRNQAYAAAASGELPVIRFGRRLVVPRQALERLLKASLNESEPKVAA